jgi:predicted lipid-binding transport protein (Tim44 family)
LAAVALLALSGCGSAATAYAPRYVAPGELTLRYDDGLEIYAGRGFLTDSPDFDGLSDFVRCVPRAAEHAHTAEEQGSAAIGTNIAGVTLGIGGLGGLSGLAYLGDNDSLGIALLGTGVAVGLLGLSMVLVSRSLRNSANGHAVDATNYYNDRVGAFGGSCDRPARRAPQPPAGPLAQPAPATPNSTAPSTPTATPTATPPATPTELQTPPGGPTPRR